MITPFRNSLMALLWFSAAALWACGGDAPAGPAEEQPPAVASVSVTPSSFTLMSIGETVQLTATARDASDNTVSSKTFTWSSSDESIATVDMSGLVTAVANGSTTITATTDNISGSAMVTVQEVASVSVTPAGVSVTGVGAARTFTAEAWDWNGNRIQSPVTWLSLNGHVATIDQAGTATAVASGQVTIAAELKRTVGHALLTVSVPGIATATSWSETTSGTRAILNGVWGTSPTDIYAVGESGTILHYDGTGWSEMSSGTGAWLEAVWGTSSSNVYAVGGSSAILHYDGGAWSAVTRRTPEQLRGVWGTSSSNIYVVGLEGVILHFDGIVWEPMESGTTWCLYDVWGTSPSDVYAVGVHRTILHFDGSSWTAMTSEGSVYVVLGALWGTMSGDLYAVGTGGRILRGSR